MGVALSIALAALSGAGGGHPGTGRESVAERRAQGPARRGQNRPKRCGKAGASRWRPTTKEEA